VDQAHEQITDLRPVQGAVEQGVLSSMEIFPYSKLCSPQNYAQSDSGVGPSTLNRPDLSGRPGLREGLQS
jgi:hypothetical protein